MMVMRQMAVALAILIAIAMGVSVLVARQRRRATEPMRATLLADLDAGSCGGLRRARALARRLVLADPRDTGSEAALAFAGALLAIDCGEPLTHDVAAAAAGASGRPGTDERARADVLAAAALIRLEAGQRGPAADAATAAVAAAPGTPQPLYALGRVRARAGDLEGASRALEAAMVAAPGFVPARLAWAEVRLDLGDVETAWEALHVVTAPDLRAQLLLDEVMRARGAIDPQSPEAVTLDAACAEPRLSNPLESAGCALREATRARLAGDRVRARSAALAAAALAPAEPRLLARIAQRLAVLGAIDRAAELVTRAEPLAAPDMPALGWAGIAVALGRGRVPGRPVAFPPPAPDGPLLEARAALAAGGVGALAAALARLGPRAHTGDPDMDQLARLARAPDAAREPVGARMGTGAGPAARARVDDPVRAYVDGLRARLDGDSDGAAEGLSRALAGHGDACRAAGEYLATLRAFKRKPAPEVFVPLRAENAGCVNLPR